MIIAQTLAVAAGLLGLGHHRLHVQHHVGIAARHRYTDARQTLPHLPQIQPVHIYKMPFS